MTGGAHRICLRAGLAAAGILVWCMHGGQLATAQPAAEPEAEAEAEAQVPRTPDGRPDMSGIWIATGAIALMEGPQALQAALDADAAAGRARPTNDPPPYKPEAEARRQEYLDRQGIDDPMARCLLTGVPRIKFRPLPFEIVQLPDRVIMLYEIHHTFRLIPTDGRPHPEDMEPTYLGSAVGRWEDDTLVVDVTGFNDRTWLVGIGTHHSESLRVTEYYTRDSHDTITYEAVMEDPEVFTEPWVVREIFRLRPGERLREYECIESNEDIQRFERLLRDDEESFRLSSQDAR